MQTFLAADLQRPHLPRRRAILAAYPRVATLIGHDPRTALIAAGLFGGQLGLAALFGRLGLQFWWALVLVAYVAGAFANHAFFVIIHDAAHNAVFKTPTANKIASILTDLPNTVPTAIPFRCYHVKHHSHLGDYDFDADLPSLWEARVFGTTWYGKALWLFFFPLLQVLRLRRIKATVPMRGWWTVANTLCVIAFDIAVLVVLGPAALLYLFASFWFSIGGLHPLTARLVQEHFTFDTARAPVQETFDYYGPLNYLALNAGYHNEHHDFPDVPWSRLPLLRAGAPEFYSELEAHRSWSRLMWRFITDPACTLTNRVDRSRMTRASRPSVSTLASNP